MGEPVVNMEQVKAFDAKYKMTEEEFMEKARDLGWLYAGMIGNDNAGLRTIYNVARYSGDERLYALIDKILRTSVDTLEIRKELADEINTVQKQVVSDGKLAEKDLTKLKENIRLNNILGNITKKEFDKAIQKRNKTREEKEAKEAKEQGRAEFYSKLRENGWPENDKNLISGLYENYVSTKKEGKSPLDEVFQKLLGTKLGTETPTKEKNDLLQEVQSEVQRSNLDNKSKSSFDTAIQKAIKDSQPQQAKEEEQLRVKIHRYRRSDPDYKKQFFDKMYGQGWTKNDDATIEKLFAYSNTYDPREQGPLIDDLVDKILEVKIGPKIPSKTKADALREFLKGVKDSKLQPSEKKYAKDSINKSIKIYDDLFRAEQKESFDSAKAAITLDDEATSKEQRAREQEFKESFRDKGKIANKLAADSIERDKQYEMKIRYQGAEKLALAGKTFDSIRKMMIAELSGYRAELALTQEDTAANFVDGAPKEGSEEYQAMTASIKAAIEKLSDPKCQIGDVRVCLADVISKSSKYHKEKDGIVGPRSDKGVARFTISDNIEKKMLRLVEGYTAAYQNYSELAKDIPAAGKPLYEHTFGEIEERTKAYVEGLIKNIPDAKYPDVEEASFTKAEELRREADKGLLLDKLSKIVRYDSSKPEAFKPEKTKSASTAAKNYLVKKYISKALQPGVSADELKDMLHFVSGKELDKTLKKYDNPMFKDIVKNSPDKYFSVWNKIDTAAEKMQKDAEEKLKAVVRDYNDEVSYVQKYVGEVNAADICGRVVTNAAEILTSKLLADPNNNMLRFALASSPEEKVGSLKNYIKKQVVEVLKNDKRKDEAGYDPIAHILNDKKLPGTLMKGFAEAEKQAAKKARPETVLENNPVKKV